MTYNWQKPNWPKFRYNLKGLEKLLFEFSHRSGQLAGVLQGLPQSDQSEAIVDLLVTEAVKTSEIEGEYISREDVKSSIRNQLGLNSQPELVADKRAVGASELMLLVRAGFREPLSQEMLFAWHRALLQGAKGVKIGGWRTHPEPMQVVSGVVGKVKVHFEAPASKHVNQEMAQFVSWYNDTATSELGELKFAPVRAAIAHLYFESIHPFEDGNGRIGRVLSEKALSQALGHPVVLSLSKTIESNKKQYYLSLETAQKADEITSWITYFVNLLVDAQKDSELLIEFVLAKARFFDRYQGQLNQRQLKVTNRMLKEGPRGFEGGMTAKKYVAITNCSKATATRDLQQLAEISAFIYSGRGRSVSYQLNFGGTGLDLI